MRRGRVWSVVLAMTAIGLVAACGPGPAHSPGVEESSAAAVDPEEDYRLIPPRQGPWLEMWSQLRGLEHVYVPVFGLESLDAALETKGYGEVRWDDLKRQFLFIQQQTPQGTLDLYAIYTDARLLDDGTPLEAVEPAKFLEFSLNNPVAGGVYFNPVSRVCGACQPEWAYGLNLFGVAELIGYLRSEPDDGTQPFHQLAVAARDRGQLFEVLYYWGMSRREGRPGDDWRVAELAKLRAYDELNFPGFRERALGEARWFLHTEGPNSEARALVSLIEAKQGS